MPHRSFCRGIYHNPNQELEEEMKHTPGTWIDKDGQIYSEETGYTIAVIPYFDKEDQEQVANAKLMASAPDLLEKLIRLTDYAEEWLVDCPGVLKDRIIRSSRDTIAEAIGE